MFQFQVLPVRGYPPPNGMVSPWKAGPTHSVMLATASWADCVLQPSVQNAPFHRGEGKMMMMMCVCWYCLCVLHVLMVCSLCYIGLPTIWRGPPPLTERNWYIYIYINIYIFISIIIYTYLISHISLSYYTPVTSRSSMAHLDGVPQAPAKARRLWPGEGRDDPLLDAKAQRPFRPDELRDHDLHLKEMRHRHLQPMRTYM